MGRESAEPAELGNSRSHAIRQESAKAPALYKAAPVDPAKESSLLMLKRELNRSIALLDVVANDRRLNGEPSSDGINLLNDRQTDDVLSYWFTVAGALDPEIRELEFESFGAEIDAFSSILHLISCELGRVIASSEGEPDCTIRDGLLSLVSLQNERLLEAFAVAQRENKQPLCQ